MLVCLILVLSQACEEMDRADCLRPEFSGGDWGGVRQAMRRRWPKRLLLVGLEIPRGSSEPSHPLMLLQTRRQPYGALRRARGCDYGVGFYLQPSVGGRPLLVDDFWRRFVEIPRVVAIKIALYFNRYQTLDVVRALAESQAVPYIALLGNDDNIVADLAIAVSN